MKHRGNSRRRECREQEEEDSPPPHRPFLRSRTRLRTPIEPQISDESLPPPSPSSRPTAAEDRLAGNLLLLSHHQRCAQEACRELPKLSAEEKMNKASIAFILDSQIPERAHRQQQHARQRESPSNTHNTTERQDGEDDGFRDRKDPWQERAQIQLLGERSTKDQSQGKRPATTQNHVTGSASETTNSKNNNQKVPKPIKKSRICKYEDCTRYVVNKGLCIGHGGGKRCSVEGCSSSAKHMGLCWKHGGSTKCTIEGCNNRAKARGVCWSHGGGKKCSEPECEKTAVSNGLCWAHGGGKRCAMEGCKKPAYGKNGNLCPMHQSADRNS